MSLACAHPPKRSRTESRRTAVQARVRWGADSVLRVHHLDHGAPYRVQVRSESVDLDPSTETAAIAVAIPEGERLRIVVPSSTTVTVVREHEHRDLLALAAAGRIEERGPAGEPSFLLEEGETAELAVGGLVHELSLVELPEPLRPAFRAPVLVAGSMLVSALLVALVTVHGHRTTSRAGGSELPNLQDRAIAALIRERARQPIPPVIRHRAVLTMPSASATSASMPTILSPAVAAPPTLPSAASASRASRAVESTSAVAAPSPEPEVDESPAPTPEELAELAALEAREHMLRRMRRQVTHLGDCYQELGLSPGDGAPSDPADRARLAECVARRERLAEASEAGPSTPHGVVEWDVVVEGRTGTAVYQGGRIAVPLSR